MSADTERELDFADLLCELCGLIGRPVSVTALSERGRTHLQASGVLAGALDLQLHSANALDCPARLALYLDSAAAHFVLRETEIARAYSYDLELCDMTGARTIEIEHADGTRLCVSEE